MLKQQTGASAHFASPTHLLAPLSRRVVVLGSLTHTVPGSNPLFRPAFFPASAAQCLSPLQSVVHSALRFPGVKDGKRFRNLLTSENLDEQSIGSVAMVHKWSDGFHCRLLVCCLNANCINLRNVSPRLETDCHYRCKEIDPSDGPRVPTVPSEW